MLLLSILLIDFSGVSQSKLPMKKISLFKNSTCLVSKEGQLKSKDDKFVLPIPSTALYGTYWLGSAKENMVKSVIFKSDTLKTQTKAKYIAQLIRANVGKDAVLILQTGEKTDKSISGKILAYIPESGLVKIKDDNGKITFISYLKVEYITFSTDNSEYTNDSIARTATLKFEKKQRICFTSGILSSTRNDLDTFIFS